MQFLLNVQEEGIMFTGVRKRQTKNELGIDWKQFYKNVLVLVVPMALQNLINVGVTAADVMMLGAVGEDVLSGASLAGQIQFIMTLIFMGITSGATVLTAQYWGKGDTRTIEYWEWDFVLAVLSHFFSVRERCFSRRR